MSLWKFDAFRNSIVTREAVRGVQICLLCSSVLASIGLRTKSQGKNTRMQFTSSVSNSLHGMISMVNQNIFKTLGWFIEPIE